MNAQPVESQKPPLSGKYTREVQHKIQKYENRTSRSTEKTLVRLSRWEKKIQNVLHKASPQAEQRLFGNGQLTFSRLLEQYRAGEMKVQNFKGEYDSYLDSLTTTIKYLNTAGNDADEASTVLQGQAEQLNATVRQSGYVRSFIRQRKKQLLNEALQYTGNTRFIRNISKESYYYTETLRNYRELFSTAGKREELARKALNEVPAFRRFMRENSMLSSLFAVPGSGAAGNQPSLAGLQTRGSVQAMIQNRIAASGPNGAAQVRQNLMAAQSRLTEIKDKLAKGGHIGSDGEIEMPDFQPNGQRSKTLWQRLVYGLDVQFGKRTRFIPSTTDIGLVAGYRLNDKSTIGAGLSYKLGMGSIDHIRLTSEGVGFRSFLDWKIRKQWYASGGYELNYLHAFSGIAGLKDAAWQRSGLIGISRQYRAGRKMRGEVRLLYDFLYRQHMPQSAPVVFRMGYRL